MTHSLTFKIDRTRFDENYAPSDSTRLTTNFANLARGEDRQSNLRKVIEMINNRFNDLANWDNPNGDRYVVDLDIISSELSLEQGGEFFPFVEMLQTSIYDKVQDKRYQGIVGNNFSSYVRDYDFSVLLLDHNKDKASFEVPTGYGDLHGKLFKTFLQSDLYQANFPKQPVLCLSVANTRIYHRTDNIHPILGVEYVQEAYSLTDEYFAKMGLRVRYFMPKGSVAPYAFYFSGDLLNDYSVFELLATIATMESFQKIYRPEIYNANAVAGKVYRPSLNFADYSSTQVVYDRVERSQLAVKQGKFCEANFIQPHQAQLDHWLGNCTL